MHCEPAAKIIEIYGGVKAVSEITGVDLSRVVRWRLEKTRGGTGGTIPMPHIPKLLRHAQENGIDISADAFVPPMQAAE